MRQRRGAVPGLLGRSAAADRPGCWGRFSVEVGVRAQAATWIRSVRFTRRQVQPQALRSGAGGGRRDRAPVPAALASRIDLGGSAGARAPAARPCLTAPTPAPISPPPLGTPQCGVLTTLQIEPIDQ